MAVFDAKPGELNLSPQLFEWSARCGLNCSER